jgi:hypothetical protein
MIEATNVWFLPLLRKTVIVDRSCHNNGRAQQSERHFACGRVNTSMLSIGIHAAGPPSA